MIIIGHELIPYTPFYKISMISQIVNTPANSTILIPLDKEIIAYCQKNSITFGVEVFSLKDALIANSAEAAFLIVNEINLAKNIQNRAEHYLFDSKILIYINHEEEISKVASFGIDGVIFLNERSIKNGEI